MKKLVFGEDGHYMSYLVRGKANIGSHYELVAEFEHWMKIYDESVLVRVLGADVIKVYRAGDFGCIIQLLEKEEI